MKSRVLFCLIIIPFISCKNIRQVLPVLAPSNIASTYIFLNTDSSYTLKTSKGAIIKITNNSFDVPKNTLVKIELKEAYTAADILLGGLTTTSNGRLLQSGGMVYFNASVKGSDVKIIKPINISVPTRSYNDSMQLFKGEVKADSLINWVNPTPLDSTAKMNELYAGELLFKANCANCHKTVQDYTGPALAGCRSREPNLEWAYAFIDNVNAMLYRDPYAKRLHAKYGSRMTQFNLPKEDIKAILDYCDKVAASGTPSSTNSIATRDAFDSLPNENKNKGLVTDSAPCGYDTVYYAVQTDSLTTIEQDTSIVIVDTSGYISKPKPTSIYQFNIVSGGWYNINCFIDNNKNAVTNVVLSAIIKNGNVDSMQVYLCIPTRRLMADGKFSSKSTYQFNHEEDSVPLILNDKAMIIAVGSINNKIYYGVKHFIIKKEQVIMVDFEESSTDEINASIHKNKLDVIKRQVDNSIQLSDTTNSFIPTNDSSKEEKTILRIIPKNCNGSKF